MLYVFLRKQYPINYRYIINLLYNPITLTHRFFSFHDKKIRVYKSKQYPVSSSTMMSHIPLMTTVKININGMKVTEYDTITISLC